MTLNIFRDSNEGCLLLDAFIRQVVNDNKFQRGFRQKHTKGNMAKRWWRLHSGKHLMSFRTACRRQTQCSLVGGVPDNWLQYRLSLSLFCFPVNDINRFEVRESPQSEGVWSFQNLKPRKPILATWEALPDFSTGHRKAAIVSTFLRTSFSDEYYVAMALPVSVSALFAPEPVLWIYRPSRESRDSFYFWLF